MAKNGERNNDGTFAKGHSGAKPKGAVSEKTKIWNEIGEWFQSEGLEAYQEELINMKQQSPAEFMKRYETLLEYFKPKLSRAEVKAEVKEDDGIDYSKLSDEALNEIIKAKSQ